MLAVSATIEDFRRLLARQVRRCLARRRTRTVIDNLIDRARPILAEKPFQRRLRHQEATFCLEGSAVEDRAATFPELRAAALALRSVPQRRGASSRVPMIYSTPDLRVALRRLSEALPVAFTIGELDRALRLALPQFLPGVLDSDAHDDRQDIDDVDGRLVAARAASLLKAVPKDLRVVVAMKVAGASDAEVGAALGVSRRTATNRKATAYGALEEVLGSLVHAERLAVLDHVGPQLSSALIQNRSRNRSANVTAVAVVLSSLIQS